MYLDCSATAARAFACTHLATGHENGDVGGDIFIDVGMTDLAGNYTLRSSVGTVTFDFTPPSPTLASVAYFPAATNPLPSVQRAMAGTVVQVAVSADESFSTPPVPGLVARLGGTAFPLTFVPGGLDEKDALFETNITEATPDGDYALEVAWSDAVGNVGTAAVSGAVVRVKTSKPSLSVDQDALVFVRSAWGNAAPEARGAYTIPAGALLRARAERCAHDHCVPAGGVPHARRRRHAVPRHRPARARRHRARGGRAAAGAGRALPAPEPLHAGRAGGLARGRGRRREQDRVRESPRRRVGRHPERTGVRLESPCGHVHRLLRHEPYPGARDRHRRGGSRLRRRRHRRARVGCGGLGGRGDGQRGPRGTSPARDGVRRGARPGRPVRRGGRDRVPRRHVGVGRHARGPGPRAPARAPARWPRWRTTARAGAWSSSVESTAPASSRTPGNGTGLAGHRWRWSARERAPGT